MAVAQKRKVMLACSFYFNQFMNFFNEEDDKDADIVALVTNEKQKIEIQQARMKEYLANIVCMDDLTFRSHFRMKRSNFEVILSRIGPIISNEFSPHVGRKTTPAEKQLLAILWLLATPDSFRSVGDRFDLDKSVIEASFQRIIQALNDNTIKDEFIIWPTESEQRLNETVDHFMMKAGFPGVIGVIDGCHIPIKPPSPAGPFMNRKKYPSVVLQATCDHKLRFTHCEAGHAGSVHDARVLRESDLYQPNKFPRGTHLLGDCAYPNRSWLLVPFKNNGHLDRNQRTYNTIHSKTRHVIENAFSLFKNRWRRFKDRLDMNRTDLIAATITAGCVLHNVALIDDDDIDEFHVGMINGDDESEDGHVYPDEELRDGEYKRNYILNRLTREQN